MSVLIKNMKMPDTCEDCNLESFCDLWVDARKMCGEWKPGVKATIRHPDCPLVDVPMPHGDLIDRNALVHDLDDDLENDQRALDEMDFVGKERERVEFDKNCKQNCLRYLSNAPTIISADESDMSSFIHIFEEDDEEDGMDSFIRILKD